MSRQNERDAIRAYMREHSCNYTTALRAIREGRNPSRQSDPIDSWAPPADLMARIEQRRQQRELRQEQERLRREAEARSERYWARWRTEHGLRDHHTFTEAGAKLPVEIAFSSKLGNYAECGRSARFRLAAGAWFTDHHHIYSSFCGLVLMYHPYGHNPVRAGMGEALNEEALKPIRDTAALNNAMWATGRVGEGPYSWSNCISSPDRGVVHSVSVVFVIPLRGCEAAAQDLANRLASQFEPQSSELAPGHEMAGRVDTPDAAAPDQDGAPAIAVSADSQQKLWDRWIRRNGLMKATDYTGVIPTATDTDPAGRFMLAKHPHTGQIAWFNENRAVYSSFHGLVIMFSPVLPHYKDGIGENLEGFHLDQIRATAAMNDAVWAAGRVGEGPHSWTGRLSPAHQSGYTDREIVPSVSIVFVLPLHGYRKEAATFATRLARQIRPLKAELSPRSTPNR